MRLASVGTSVRTWCRQMESGAAAENKGARERKMVSLDQHPPKKFRSGLRLRISRNSLERSQNAEETANGSQQLEENG